MFQYLHNFAALIPLISTECNEALYTLQKVAAELGIPLTAEKQEEPTYYRDRYTIVMDICIQSIKNCNYQKVSI